MTYLPLPKVPARRVAFIGLGTMGSGMAARLVAAGRCRILGPAGGLSHR